MFFLFFAVFALCQHYGASIPVILDDVIDPRDSLQPGPAVVQTHKMRTRFDIVWSCVTTLFICTWVAIHPNIPPRGEGHLRSVWRRIKLMLCTLVVPELVVIWAYRQWAAARYISEYFQDEGWTPTHAHFLIMGGFTYFDGEIERVLGFDDFRRLLGIPFRTRLWSEDVEEPGSSQISFPTITAAEIQDKARGDFLSKAIVILQSIWFIVQCVARGKQGLALTELELVTLALASLNGLMYYFWWDKPLGVNEPVKLYRKGREPAERVVKVTRRDHDERYERIRDAPRRSLVQRVVVCPFQQLQSSLSQFFGHFCTMLSSCYVQLTISPSSINTFIHEQRRRLNFPGDTYIWYLYLPIQWFLINPVAALVDPLFGIVTTEAIVVNSAHVPTFYAPITVSRDTLTLLFFVLPTVAVLFGGLHCIGWNFNFPTNSERLLWRIGSLAITSIPSMLFVDGLVIEYIPGAKPMVWAVLRTVSGFLLVTYMLARLLLLTQAVVLLRKQPESAFYAINWSDFLPHI